MANTSIPSKGIDPRIHNHVVNTYAGWNKTNRKHLKFERFPRWLRSSIKNQIYQNQSLIRQFRKEGFKSL